jgi:hypothetical protein
MNKKFRENQRYLEDMSDDAYSWMFNKNNPMYKQNIDFRDKVYLDRELRNRFGISFTDLEPIEEYKSKYEELLNSKRKITKDQLRLWIVQNYENLSSII